MKYILILAAFVISKTFLGQEIIRVSFYDSCVIRDVKISVTDLSKLSGLCPSNLKKVNGYTIRISERDTSFSVKVDGKRWGREMGKVFLKLKPGSNIIFENISGLDYKGEKASWPVINVQITKN